MYQKPIMDISLELLNEKKYGFSIIHNDIWMKLLYPQTNSKINVNQFFDSLMRLPFLVPVTQAQKRKEAARGNILMVQLKQGEH